MPAQAAANGANVDYANGAVAATYLEHAATGLFEDPLIEQFVKALLPPDEAERVMCGQYTEALHTTLLTRIGRLRSAGAVTGQENVKPLPKWRLKRVQEFVETNIENRLSLESLARSAGLSRMYFAAQFRAATGSSPHEYVTNRRIARAKELLAASERSLVDIALTTGFQTQSHFTTVFKRAENITPHRWRILHAENRRTSEGPTARSKGLRAPARNKQCEPGNVGALRKDTAAPFEEKVSTSRLP